jgi:hypothetical protein
MFFSTYWRTVEFPISVETVVSPVYPKDDELYMVDKLIDEYL